MRMATVGTQPSAVAGKAFKNLYLAGMEACVHVKKSSS